MRAIRCTYRYGGKRGRLYRLIESSDLVVLRTHSRRPVEAGQLSGRTRRLLDELAPVVRFDAAGVEVLRLRARAAHPRNNRAAHPRHNRSALRDRAAAALSREPDCRFAARALADPISGAPVIYTENFFVKFQDRIRPSACRRALAAHGLNVKRELDYARNAYFAGAPEGTGRRIFRIARDLLASEGVELCHPELVREAHRRRAFPEQWHLRRTRVAGRTIAAHARVEEAWEISQGGGTTIAIIDDGFDVDHEEFASAGKVVAPVDVTLGRSDPRPGSGDDHGTACAGVACADGARGASGVAPRARLLPVRLTSGLGSQSEADAFLWAARNGADVISCSWGPADGRWWDASDPAHHAIVALPDSTRLAIDWTIEHGRGGRGCVIVWAAGNGGESVDNDGYASNPKVIAVGATNDRSRRAVYSDHGEAVFCSFPSSDARGTRTPGIWTTDRSGAAGYNPGQPTRGDVSGNYTNDFGGTSSACPGAAGVAALVIARAPGLPWLDVREVLRRSCTRLDRTHGGYDRRGHSPYYGYGRLNARAAVLRAGPAAEATGPASKKRVDSGLAPRHGNGYHF